MRNKLFIILSFFAFSGAFALIGANSAGAASGNYDHVIYPTTNMVVQQPTSPPGTGSTFDWDIISNPAPFFNTYCGGSYLDLWEYTRDGGGQYLIIKDAQTSGGNTPRRIHLYYTASFLNPGLTWQTNSVNMWEAVLPRDSNLYHAQFQVESNGSVSGSCDTPAYPGSSIQISAWMNDRNQAFYPYTTTPSIPDSANEKLIFISTYEPNYPVGYIGNPINQSPPTPVRPDSPNVSITSGTSYNFTAIDTNFNTFDDYPFLCADETAPIWHYEMWDGQDPDTDELFTSGTLSATGTLSLLLDPSTDWTLVSYYSCSDDDPQFNTSSFDYFSTDDIDYATYKPSWYVSNAIDFKANIHDTNFNTFDANPFTCSEGLAPVLHWTIYDLDNVLTLDSGVQSATAQIDYQFPKGMPTTRYQVSGYYDCGSTDPLQFDPDAPGTYEFEITSAGTLNVNLMDDCVTETFPFINIEGCLNNMTIVLNLLSFNTINFANTWAFSDSCRTLVVINGWLNLPPGYQACPQIPSFVRNVTTPFVTFALGLLTITFLARNKGSEW